MTNIDPQHSLGETAYREIETMIVRLELSPGAAISEATLCERLGIGRTPVREALQQLARESLIQVVPRRGIFVTEIRVDAQLRLIEVRRGLERLIASRAARMANVGQRSELTQIASDMRACGRIGDGIAFLAHDMAFNRLMTVACDNEFAASAIRLIAGLSRRFWYRYYESHADLAKTADLHADVAHAVAGGDSAESSQASERLVDYIERFTRSVFDANIFQE